MEALHLSLVHLSASLIYLVDERCVLLAPIVLLCHQSNCLQSAVEPSRSPLPNSGTACLTGPISLCLYSFLFMFVFLCLSCHTAYMVYYCNTVRAPGDKVETGLLQLSASRSTTRDDRTIATCAECRCSPDLRAGYSRACHGEPPSVALAAGPLAGPVQVVLSHALSLLRKVPGQSRQRRESRRLRSSTSRSSIFVVVELLSAAVTHQFGERAFTLSGPSSWNSLPKDLRAVTDPGLFRKRLKTHFFTLAFCVC